MRHELYLGVVDPVRCGCDPNATGDLIPVDEALALGIGLAQPSMVTERLAVREAIGRVLAQPVRAGLPLTTFAAPTELGQGDEILSAGRIVGSREVGTLAAVGQEKVAVRRRIEVALLTTGSELTSLGVSSAAEAIYKASRIILATQLSAPWMQLHDFGVVAGDLVRLRRVLALAAEHADLIVTTGGVSVGAAGHMARLVREAGGIVHVASIAMRPGEPLTIGQIGRAIWIGLPDDPVAAFVGWTVIGARIAEAMTGIVAGGPRKQVVRLGSPTAHYPGRCEFRLARVLGYDAHGAQVVDLLPAEASRRVAFLAQADGLALIPAEAEALAAGTMVEFLPF